MRVAYDQLTDEQIRNAEGIAAIDPQTGLRKTLYNGSINYRPHPAGPYAMPVIEVELAGDDARFHELCRRVAAVKKTQRDEAARELARRHYQVEPGLTRVIQFSGAPALELPVAEPIKLLEVNTNTIASGIAPLGFGPAPEAGIRFPSVIIEVTPDEFEKIEAKELLLPKGWEFKQHEIPKPPEAAEAR